MTRCLVIATACAFGPNIAAAQSAAPPENPAPPAISVSVAAGPMQHSAAYSPIVIASAQFAMGRWIRFEAEAGHSAASHIYTEVRPDDFASVEKRRVWIAGANVLFRGGTRRFGGFAGGGFGVHRIRSSFDEGVQINRVPNGRITTVTDTRPGMQIVGGAEVHLGGRLGGFAAFRGELLPNPNLGVTAGVRVALKAMQTAEARRPTPGAAPATATARDGKEIRVTMRTGERRSGRFVSLNSSELVMSWGRNRDVIPLREVRRIETVTHHARRGALMGLVGGIGFALAVCLADDNFCGDDAGFGLSAAFFGGLGAGIGAGLGAMVNASTADRHVLFENSPNPVAEVAPILGPGLAGAAVRLRWGS